MTTVPPTTRRDHKGPRSNPGQLLTVGEAAKRLGATEHFTRRLIKERRIDYVKLGDGRRSPVRIRENVLEAFIAERTIEAAG